MNTVVIAAQTDAGVWTAASRLAVPLDEWNLMDPEEQDEVRATVRRAAGIMAPKGAKIHVGVHYSQTN